MRSRLVDIEVKLHHKTDKAFLVSLDGDREKAVWVPASRCEMECTSRVREIYDMTLDGDYATELGLT